MQRARRALMHQGGAIDRVGDERVAARLAQVLAQAGRVSNERLTHGFHGYPARMHPPLAGAALEAFASVEGGPVLDPFCGSGTVLVEARARGVPAVGVDLNPIALKIAAVQCQHRDEASLARLRAAVVRVAEGSSARVRGRVRVRAPLPVRERAFYAPHVLLELAGLHAEVQALQSAVDLAALEVVFSSLLVKFSRQRANTSEQIVERRIRKGLVTELFARRGNELCDRLSDLAEVISHAGPEPPPVELVEADARRLSEALPPGFAAGLVLTSPPYGGTYDYVDHHARRYPWFGMSDRNLRAGEIGARRNLAQAAPGVAVRTWERELGDALAAMARVTAREGWILLWLGDAHVGGQRLDASRQVQALAPMAGLRFRASASQPRPDFQGGRARREHLIALRV
ncbi:MAG: hypothetical protein OXU20_03125 [Myxococcales bacterium]|nr:hypothetical protein [Myxococcales bacterium]